MTFIIDEFGGLNGEQMKWLRTQMLAHNLVESSVDELVDVGSIDDCVPGYDAAAVHFAGVEFSSNANASLQAALSEINRLSANCAALLQRWAIIHNLFERGAPVGSVVAVAQLSADEVVLQGADYCGERLIRQERAARGIGIALNYLEHDDIRRGSGQHKYLRELVHAMSSYPQIRGAAGAMPSQLGKC